MKSFFKSIFSSSVHAIVFALIFAGTLGSVAYALDSVVDSIDRAERNSPPLLDQLFDKIGLDDQNIYFNASGGNFGIGTTNPEATLHVEGDIYASEGLKPHYDSDWFKVEPNTLYSTMNIDETKIPGNVPGYLSNIVMLFSPRATAETPCNTLAYTPWTAGYMWTGQYYAGGMLSQGAPDDLHLFIAAKAGRLIHQELNGKYFTDYDYGCYRIIGYE